MSEEIPLGAPEGGGRRVLFLALGIAIGLAAGVGLGYWAKYQTLQYAYSLLSQSQPPPMDIYLVAYSPGQMAILTAAGTPILQQRLGLTGHFSYAGSYGPYSIFLSNGTIYVFNGTEEYTELYLKGVEKGVVVGNSLYVVAAGGVYKLSLPDLSNEGFLAVKDADDIYAIPGEGVLYVLTPNSLVELDGALRPLAIYDVGGDRVFVGAYYLFIANGASVTSYSRTTLDRLASTSLAGTVRDMRACRGVLLVATSRGLYALSVPGLSELKFLNVTGNELEADPSCTVVYLAGDHRLYAITVPSLSISSADLPAPLDGLEIRAGALTAQPASAPRQIALACGG
ncbi:hypothetical protein TUZN_1101 [Thermoproteus uzoniensis 768-20]|uniref:Uncharacterized protein n=1 Tax=Thermoproteus uzoniensis (strain 768-20) TaxID=999630 RepID=F2L099_THEU7|nr:hypothetical protein [Thermoproteus uzoniensis]AEA12581.1 hypothetical protein TUZN_1101 [Thermoproteus uzoniensis 768-20]